MEELSDKAYLSSQRSLAAQTLQAYLQEIEREMDAAIDNEAATALRQTPVDPVRLALLWEKRLSLKGLNSKLRTAVKAAR